MVEMKRVGGLVALSVTVVSIVASLGVTPLEQSKGDPPPPGGMMLLPGYRHAAIGIGDSRRGKIWKEGGPLLTYDIGGSATPFATQKPGDKPLWTKETVVGQTTKFVVSMQADGTTLVVGIGSGVGFAAQNVGSKEEMAEVLLMLVSYRAL